MRRTAYACEERGVPPDDEAFALPSPDRPSPPSAPEPEPAPRRSPAPSRLPARSGTGAAPPPPSPHSRSSASTRRSAPSLASRLVHHS